MDPAVLRTSKWTSEEWSHTRGLHGQVRPWPLVHEKKGVHVSEDRQKGGLTYTIKSVATVRASLDDIMDVFVAATTTEYRALMQMLLCENFADSAVLYHREQNDTENLSIKWLAMRGKKSSINPMVQHNDFCVLEYAGVIGQDIIGGEPEKPIGICLYESIEQLEYPDLWDSHRLERGSISKCGYLGRATERRPGTEGANDSAAAKGVARARPGPYQRAARWPAELS